MKYHEILAVDPGTHCGFARFIDGLQTELGTLHHPEEIWPWIGKQRTCNLWVVEDYKVRSKEHGGFDHEFQSLFPSQVIGAIKFFAYNCGVDVVLQQPQIKYAASPMLFGKPYKKQSNRHYVDAAIHGLYWLKKNPG